MTHQPLNLQTLARLIRDHATSSDATEFLNHLITESEQEALINRMAILVELHKGSSYQDISDRLGVSAATIASVSKLVSEPCVQESIELIKRDQAFLKLLKN